MFSPFALNAILVMEERAISIMIAGRQQHPVFLPRNGRQFIVPSVGVLFRRSSSGNSLSIPSPGLAG